MYSVCNGACTCVTVACLRKSNAHEICYVRCN